MKKTICLVSAAAVMAFAATAYAAPRAADQKTDADARFNFRDVGDIAQALNALHHMRPQLTVLAPTGTPTSVPIRLNLRNVTLTQALQAIGEQGGNKVDVLYDQRQGTARLAYHPTSLRVADPRPAQADLDSGDSPYGDNAQAEARRWQAGEAARPIMGSNGLLEYPFGQGQPALTCAPLRACDIQLQPGEVINNVILGDKQRWLPAPATTGEGANAVQHVIVKPTEIGIETNMLVTTNRRTYEVTLKSAPHGYVSRIGWYYPADMVENWNGAAQLAARKAAEDEKRKVADMPIINFSQLDLDGYKIEGDKNLPWYPVRVFDDGVHVYIQMPGSIQSSDAPALVLFDRGGHSELVNYRVKQAEQGGSQVTYYVVDKLFRRAGLILGVGGDQKKVEIDKVNRRDDGRRFWFNNDSSKN